MAAPKAFPALENALAITTILLLLSPSLALAWGKDGHRVVARIAEKHLTAKAKQAVQQILGGETLASVAVWADEVRRSPKFKWTAPLHFVNVAKGSAEYDAARDCPESCVVKAIDGFASTLLDPQPPLKRSGLGRTAPLHFVNVAKGSAEYDAARDCPESCVVKAIDGFASTLLDPQPPLKRRRRLSSSSCTLWGISTSHFTRVTPRIGVAIELT